MKLNKTFWLIVAFWLAMMSAAQGHTNVTVSQARSMINSNDDLIVVDVRELSSEYCPGHIIGAVNYPWNSSILQSRYGELPINGTILVVCKSGTRSNNAANFLDGKGFTNIYDMTGGMNSWTFETVGCVSETNTGSNEPTMRLDAQQIVKTALGLDIKVNGVSAGSMADWNNDSKKDLVIGQGSGSYPDAKVRVYLNTGTTARPEFSNYFFVQSNGIDLVSAGSGDLGCFPVVAYGFRKILPGKDLIIGQADGKVKLFYNIGTDENPTYDSGRYLKTGTTANNKVGIDVGARATPCMVDWNNDGWLDMVSGGLDGKIHIYINCQCDAIGVDPGFAVAATEGIFAQENGSDLVVPQLCSSPVVRDFDGDGKKDIITGNSAGQLLFYKNVGSDAAPSFSGYTIVKSNGVKIDLDKSILQPAARSMPTVCNFNGDRFSDILVGGADGKVRIFQGISSTADLNGDGDIDAFDLVKLADRWQINNCTYCGGGDLSGDGKVDTKDLRILADNWLSMRYKFYEANMDTDPGWTRQGQWQFGQPLGLGGSDDSYPDPNSGFTGTNVYGVNLNGNYALNPAGPYYLIAGPIDCTGHNNVKLKFARWLNTDYAYYAQATIEVSSNGTDWNLVWQQSSDSFLIVDNQWQQMEYDISSIAGNQQAFYIRWGYKVNRPGAAPFSGWNIDDVQLWDNPQL